jgi:hypothetical protein
MPRFAAVLPFVTMVLAIGCSKSRSSQLVPAPEKVANSQESATNSAAPTPGGDADLIRQAVEDHVRNDREINLSAIDMTVDSVKVNGNQAEAQATFRIKQGDASMEMVYFLERHGNGWRVTKDQPANGQFVHPPMDQTHSNTTPGPAAPEMPDVQEFLRQHPAPSSN